MGVRPPWMGFGTLVVPLGTLYGNLGSDRHGQAHVSMGIGGVEHKREVGCPLNRVDPEWTLSLWTLSRQLGKTCSEIGIPLYARLIGVREVKNGSWKCFGELHWHLRSVNQKLIQG